MGFLHSILLFIIFSIIFNQFVLHLHVSAKEVFSPGDELNSLNSTSYLVSVNGRFTLGFFTFNIFTYLGIWYTNIKYGQKVWVANRDAPLIIDSGVMLMDDSGTLKIVDRNDATFFNIFYNQVGSGNTTNTRGVLEDSGNFVIYDGKNRILWQSFDYPTDTLIPGMKLGYNLTTRHNWTLLSSSDYQVPTSGIFTMTLERYQNSPQLIIYGYGEVYWASGPWKNGTFQFGNFLSVQNMSMIYDASGMYIAFPTIGDPASSNLQLVPNGDLVENFNFNGLGMVTSCSWNHSYDGCIDFEFSNCRDETLQFRLFNGDWNGGSTKYDYNSSISLDDCMGRCWKDCDCMGVSKISNDTGCITWSPNKQFQFVDESFHQTADKYVLVSPKINTWNVWGFFQVAIAPTLALACLCYVIFRRLRLKVKEKKKRDEFIHQLTGSNSFNYGDELEKGIKDAPDVKIFSLKAILAATNNFSNENKLGQGGYGPVYKGKLFDGRAIAVKRLSKTSGQGIEQFKSELILISKLQHTNLVRLYGCCIHQEEKMLIYELMPNKSLDFFLFDDDEKEKVDWRIRFKIIEGVAQGLLYLHKYSRMRVIHRDLKVSNILLDEDMNPKIADFGLARIFQQNMTEAVTRRVVGTFGYMAPEYAMQGAFSIKSDVFSFGVLILEIISGKRNSSFYNYETPLNLVGYAWNLWKRNDALGLKDEALGESYDMKQLLRSIHIGLLCVQENADDRPTMSEVMLMLNNEIVDLSNPNQPAFFTQPTEDQSVNRAFSRQ